MIRILFVGPLWVGTTSRQRMLGFRKLGFEVEPVDTTPPDGHALKSLGARLGRRIGLDWDLAGANQRILEAVNRCPPELIWIEKGLTIKPKVLSEIKQRHPGIRLIAYSPDDMLLPTNQSRSYRRSIARYDWHVTHKSFNVSELTALGAKQVYYTTQSFDEQAYYPRQLTASEQEQWGADVAFLGGYEQPRFETMLAVAQMGIRVRIWGPGWECAAKSHANLEVRPGWVQAEDAAKVFSGTKINLHYLRKVARDLHTTRSVEIPACKAFMLAERTQEHIELFAEGREAEYFDDVAELIAKLTAYLQNDERRLALAEAGYQRCQSSGYSNQRRLREILDVVWA
ncbi:MAG: glycosyltransferase [Chromatiaceae bacterium]|nr:glycosyltransferase [Chromatiaceae bacterium]